MDVDSIHNNNVIWAWDCDMASNRLISDYNRQQTRHSIQHACPQDLLPRQCRVMHRCVRKLSQQWFRLWFINCSASSYYLNQSWKIVSQTCTKNHQWYFNRKGRVGIYEKHLKMSFTKRRTFGLRPIVVYVLLCSVAMSAFWYLFPGEWAITNLMVRMMN